MIYTKEQKEANQVAKHYHWLSILGAMTHFHMTQTEVANITGVGLRTVKRAIKEIDSVSLDTMRKIDYKFLAYIDENFKGDSRYKLHQITCNLIEGHDNEE